MPCNLQPARAGLNSTVRSFGFTTIVTRYDVENRALCNRRFRTPSGPEGSSGKEVSLCAAGLPGWSLGTGLNCKNDARSVVHIPKIIV